MIGVGLNGVSSYGRFVRKAALRKPPRVSRSEGSKCLSLTTSIEKKGVIVRRLASIENLGSMDLLCTDKTGTLTEGEIRLAAAVDASTRQLRQAFPIHSTKRSRRQSPCLPWICRVSPKLAKSLRTLPARDCRSFAAISAMRTPTS